MKYTLTDKVAAAKEIVKTFHMERIAFLVIAVISTLLIIFLAVYTFLEKEMSWEVFSALFLPAGGICYSASLILQMFKKTLQFLKDELK